MEDRSFLTPHAQNLGNTSNIHLFIEAEKKTFLSAKSVVLMCGYSTVLLFLCCICIWCRIFQTKTGVLAQSTTFRIHSHNVTVASQDAYIKREDDQLRAPVYSKKMIQSILDSEESDDDSFMAETRSMRIQ